MAPAAAAGAAVGPASKAGAAGRVLGWAPGGRRRRGRSPLARLALALALLLCGLLALAMLPALVFQALFGGGAAPGGVPPGSGIPAAYVTLYREAERVFGVNWLLLASIHDQETDFGRLDLPGVRSGVNSFGCCAGPMQFNLFDTWGAYRNAYRQGRRPPGDYPLNKRTLPSCVGHRDERSGCVYDSFDAIMAAGQKLRSQGAGMDLNSAGVRNAVFGYNRAGWYVDAVLERARRWQAAAQAPVTSPFQPGILEGVGAATLAWPVRGPIVSPFGMRWGRLHAGIDIAVPTGTPILAAASGRIAVKAWVGGYGNYTCLDHRAGYRTCYAHQSRYGPGVAGQLIGRGQLVGYVGCTGHCFGPHLHFEVRIHGQPVDPMPYLARR